MRFGITPPQEKPRAPQNGDEFLIPEAQKIMNSFNHVRQDVINRDPSFIVAETEDKAKALAQTIVKQPGVEMIIDETIINDRQQLSAYANQSVQNSAASKPLAYPAPTHINNDPISWAHMLVEEAHTASPNTTVQDFEDLIK